MTVALQLAIALCLDAVWGEPKWLWSRAPHPAVLMGRVVSGLDRKLNRGPVKRLSGVLATSLLVLSGAAAGWAVSLLGDLVTIVAAAILLAQKALVDHVRAVGDGLRLSVETGRRAVSMIVSRDTRSASPADVARAALESLAENFSDGVVAPAFWFLMGGLPGLTVYKMVNTADSMIGYRTPKYAQFGWAAARLDDVLNWVPARLTAAALAVVGGAYNWHAIRADAALHRSPNAGWPEAALAHSLSLALAGPRSYHGETQAFDWVNDSGKQDLTPADIDAGVTLVWKTWSAGVALLFVCGGAMWLF